jgi:hypothetical protein
MSLRGIENISDRASRACIFTFGMFLAKVCGRASLKAGSPLRVRMNHHTSEIAIPPESRVKKKVSPCEGELPVTVAFGAAFKGSLL